MSNKSGDERKENGLFKMLSFLENPKYPSVGPHLRLLGFAGLWRSDFQSNMSKFKHYLFYVTIGFFFTQYFKFFIYFNYNSLLLILHFAPFHMGIVKSCFFQKDYEKWKNLIHYLSELERDQLRNATEELKEIIHEYIRRSRRVTYSFWAMAIISNISIFTEPYQVKVDAHGSRIYFKIFDGYFPYSDVPPGYYVSMFVQTFLGHIVSCYVVGWDTLICTIMIFFAGQLKIARYSGSRLIDQHKLDQSQINMEEFHKHYFNLVKYQKLFNELISPVMFIYLNVITVNLGVCIIQIARLRNDLTALVFSCLFVVSCLVQLLLFYWHSNEVTEESLLVSYGTFESDWYLLPKKQQRNMQMLGAATTKRMVFKAGPFNEMSLKTFVMILRATYSFYTLLSETE